jgi:hypothetical protein
MLIEIEKIICSTDIQSRIAIDVATVQNYAEEMNNGAVFPPVTVFDDGDGSYWLADGFHRVEACKLVGIDAIVCEVKAGGKTEALIFSCGSNAQHGLPRTNADKRRAVLLLLNDDRFAGWSTRQLAEACRVSHTFVSKIQKDLKTPPPPDPPPPDKTYPWDRDDFKESCKLWNKDFHGAALAMQLLGYPLETIAEVTGKDLESVERLFNPQFPDRCKPFRKWLDHKGDEQDNYGRGETLLQEGDAEFFKTAYNTERKMLVHHLRLEPWLMASQILRGNPVLQETALKNYSIERDRVNQLRKTLDTLGLTYGLGKDGMIAEMAVIMEKEKDKVTKDDFLLYAAFDFLCQYTLRDALWACGYSQEEPASHWIEKAKFIYECVNAVWEWYSETVNVYTLAA